MRYSALVPKGSLYANLCFAFLAAKIDNDYCKVHVFKWSPMRTAEPVME